MTVGSPPTTTDCPYRGIHPFRYVDREYFFGREALVHELFAKVLLYRLVVLFGESGAGKSSLVNAGLIPVLLQEGLNAERVRVRPILDQPMLIKRIRANREGGRYLPTIFGGDDLASCGSKDTVPCSVEGFLTAVAEKSNQARPLLVFDQFEELFTLFEPREGQITGAQPLQKEILDTILQIAKDEKLRAKIVVSIREDYLGKLEVLARDYPQILDYRVRLRYLSAEDTGQAIRGPFEAKPPSAERVTDKKGPFIPQLTKQLADRIVRDLSGSSGELVSPTHVQIVCTRLWEKYASHMPEIGETQYQVEGGLKGILEGFFGTELDKIEPRDLRAVAVATLASLITASGTRDVVSEEKLKKLLESRDVTPESFRSVLKSLEDRRLVNNTPQRGTYFYEVASEYLIRPIQREARELATEQDRLEAARARAEAEKQARQAKKFRLLAAALGGMLVVALGAILFAFWQNAVARARQLVAMSILAEITDPELSLLIAAQSVAATWRWGHTVLPEAETQLHGSILASNVRLTLRGHSGSVSSVAWSRDGKRLATGSNDNTAKVWDPETGKELLTLRGHSDSVSSVAWSRDGKRLATGSDDNTAKVWDPETGKELLTLRGHEDVVNCVGWSPNGKRLATGGVDETKVWDARSGKKLLTLRGHSGYVHSVAWSPNGERLATSDAEGTVRLWDTRSGKVLLRLSGGGGTVQSVAWSPDGKLLATDSGQDTASVWDATSGKEVRRLTGHREVVTSVAWSPDGKWLATGSADGTAKVWDPETGKELLTLSGHSDSVSSVAWSPDGKLLATGSQDRTVKVWRAMPGKELLRVGGYRVAWSPDGTRVATASHDAVRVRNPGSEKPLLILYSGAVSSVAWSPDGQVLATTAGGSQDESDHESDEETTKLWDTASGKVLVTLSGHNDNEWYVDEVWSVAWSPDGKRLATGNQDHTARLWEAASGKKLLTLNGHGDAVVSVAWSPDGKRLATGSEDNTVKVWDPETGKELVTLRGHRSTVLSVAWRPDGKRLATGSGETISVRTGDHTARVWDAVTWKELLTLSSHSECVNSVAWSPDGKRLATGSEDHTVKVWDAENGKELLTLGGHSDGVMSVAWNPDGKHLASASSDGTVQVYAMDVRDLMALARQRVTAHPSEEGCRKYLHVDKCPPVPQLSFW